MPPKGALNGWLERAAKTTNPDELVAYEEVLDQIKIDQDAYVDHDDESEIGKFYENQSVFVTGGSGFLGKSIVEKLLRSCPKIKEIFILIRPKRGVDIETRLKLMFHLSLFDRIRSKQNGAKLLSTKIIPILGDIRQPLLGICERDLNFLCARVNIIINSAASVKFTEPVNQSTQVNVMSLDELLKIAMRMVKLRAFVHVSTCYANCERNIIEEKLYESPIEPDELIERVKKIGNDSDESKELEKLLPKYNRPNSYTFTKTIAESLLNKRSKSLESGVKVCIVRPSIIGATWREPIRGWVDNTFAATGLNCDLASGSSSHLYSNYDLNVDLIPVDMCANTIIAAIWAISKFPDEYPNMSIFNASSGTVNPVTWAKVAKEFSKMAMKYPYDNASQTPSSLMVNNDCLHSFIEYYDSFNAAKNQLICDIFGGDIPIWLNHKTAVNRRDQLGYFTNREWKFLSTNTRSIWNKMSRLDRDLFHISASSINWKNYFKSYYIGTK